MFCHPKSISETPNLMSEKKQKIALIIGGGPAGLTAAYELVSQTDIKVIVVEISKDMGGISKTVNYKGNRIDIGGHRFFSKSDRVMEWWRKILPIQGQDSKEALQLQYQKKQTSIQLDANGPDASVEDKVLLVRNRMSRIYFLRNFFSYPISLSIHTLKTLGWMRSFRIGLSYIKSAVFPIRKEVSLEDFLINRFGRELYETFFKDYTEKVWGVPCSEISSEWGAQRIKGLSIWKTIVHALSKASKKDRSIAQKDIETSLIENFLYPKYGPGQMWEEVSAIVSSKGAEVKRRSKVIGLKYENGQITSCEIENLENGTSYHVEADYVFSTMPIKELIRAMGSVVPPAVKEVSDGLIYRDFITVGVLLKKLKVKNQTGQKTYKDLIPDNWIYIQEKDVKLGRLQVFNNWSPYMVKDKDTVWLGLEYFCNEGDALWEKSDEDFAAFAIDELKKIDLIHKEDVLDSTVIRMPKTYPAYFGTYDRFDELRAYTDKIENLYLVGRNGMHKYNNQDHSMLTAMEAVENIISGRKDKDNIWAVNTEQEYHEESK